MNNDHNSCHCQCHKCNSHCAHGGYGRRYITMQPLNLDHNVTIPAYTVIRGPINPYWFEDNIVKVYHGDDDGLTLNDIIRQNSKFDICVEDNGKKIFEQSMPEIQSVDINCNCHDVKQCKCNNCGKCGNCGNNRKCKCQRHNCRKCNNKTHCTCCKPVNLDDRNMIIFDVGEPSRVVLEEMGMFETLREIRERKPLLFGDSRKVIDLPKRG